jgi:hypothetical protein
MGDVPDGPDGWEARMSARTKARERHRETIRRVAERVTDPHRDHHTHLAGTSVYCSCGEFRGVATVAFDEDVDAAAWSCQVCGARGVIAIGGQEDDRAAGEVT